MALLRAAELSLVNRLAGCILSGVTVEKMTNVRIFYVERYETKRSRFVKTLQSKPEKCFLFIQLNKTGNIFILLLFH